MTKAACKWVNSRQLTYFLRYVLILLLKQLLRQTSEIGTSHTLILKIYKISDTLIIIDAYSTKIQLLLLFTILGIRYP